MADCKTKELDELVNSAFVSIHHYTNVKFNENQETDERDLVYRDVAFGQCSVNEVIPFSQVCLSNGSILLFRRKIIHEDLIKLRLCSLIKESSCNILAESDEEEIKDGVHRAYAVKSLHIILTDICDVISKEESTKFETRGKVMNVEYGVLARIIIKSDTGQLQDELFFCDWTATEEEDKADEKESQVNGLPLRICLTCKVICTDFSLSIQHLKSHHGVEREDVLCKISHGHSFFIQDFTLRTHGNAKVTVISKLALSSIFNFFADKTLKEDKSFSQTSSHDVEKFSKISNNHCLHFSHNDNDDNHHHDNNENDDSIIKDCKSSEKDGDSKCDDTLSLSHSEERNRCVRNGGVGLYPVLSSSPIIQNSRNSSKTLKCPKCNWHYKYQETLEIHMRQKHKTFFVVANGSTNNITECYASLKTTCAYCMSGEAHPKLCRGESYQCGYKPYQCDICNYSTTTKGNLSIHEQSDKHIHNLQVAASTTTTKQNGGDIQKKEITSKKNTNYSPHASSIQKHKWEKIDVGTFEESERESLDVAWNSQDVLNCLMCMEFACESAEEIRHHLQTCESRFEQQGKQSEEASKDFLICLSKDEDDSNRVLCAPCGFLVKKMRCQKLEIHTNSNQHQTKVKLFSVLLEKMQPNLDSLFNCTLCSDFTSDKNPKFVSISQLLHHMLNMHNSHVLLNEDWPLKSVTIKRTDNSFNPELFFKMGEKLGASFWQKFIRNKNILSWIDKKKKRKFAYSRKALFIAKKITSCQKIQCDVCHLRQFRTLSQLFHHKVFHLTKSFLFCEMCSKQFYAFKLYKKHLEAKVHSTKPTHLYASSLERLKSDISDIKKSLLEFDSLEATVESSTSSSSASLSTSSAKEFKQREGSKKKCLPNKAMDDSLIFTSSTWSSSSLTRDNKCLKEEEEERELALNQMGEKGFKKSLSKATPQSSGTMFKCLSCQIDFNSRQQLCKHYKSILHRGKVYEKCNSIDKYLSPKRPFKCQICQESFTQKNILYVHYNSVSHLNKLKKFIQSSQVGELKKRNILPESQFSEEHWKENYQHRLSCELEKLGYEELLKVAKLSSTYFSQDTLSKLVASRTALSPTETLYSCQLCSAKSIDNSFGSVFDFKVHMEEMHAFSLKPHQKTSGIKDETPCEIPKMCENKETLHKAIDELKKELPIADTTSQVKNEDDNNNNSANEDARGVKQSNASLDRSNSQQLPFFNLDPALAAMNMQAYSQLQLSQIMHANSIMRNLAKNYTMLSQFCTPFMDFNYINYLSNLFSSSPHSSAPPLSSSTSSSTPSTLPITSSISTSSFAATDKGRSGEIASLLTSVPSKSENSASTVSYFKRARTRITDSQLHTLRSNFDINNSPCEKQIQEIVKQTNLPEKVIKHWFRNTLFKERQRNKDSPYNFNVPPVSPTFLDDSKILAASSPPHHKSLQQEVSCKEKTLISPTDPSSLGVKGAKEVIVFEEEQNVHRAYQSVQIQRSSSSPLSPSPSLVIASSPQISSTLSSPSSPKKGDQMPVGVPLSNQPSINFFSMKSHEAETCSEGDDLHFYQNDEVPMGGDQNFYNIGSVSSSSQANIVNNSKRANRTRFTNSQVLSLQQAFEKNAYPKDDELEVLSAKLNLSPRVIVVWFQNARQKMRKLVDYTPFAPNAIANPTSPRSPQQSIKVIDSKREFEKGDTSSPFEEEKIDVDGVRSELLQIKKEMVEEEKNDDEKHDFLLNFSAKAEIPESVSDNCFDFSIKNECTSSSYSEESLNEYNSNLDDSAKRRLRTTILPDQLALLQKAYLKDSNPCRQSLAEISMDTGLNKRVVQVWFQNARARERRGQFVPSTSADESPPLLHSSPKPAEARTPKQQTKLPDDPPSSTSSALFKLTPFLPSQSKKVSSPLLSSLMAKGTGGVNNFAKLEEKFLPTSNPITNNNSIFSSSLHPKSSIFQPLFRHMTPLFPSAHTSMPPPPTTSNHEVNNFPIDLSIKSSKGLCDEDHWGKAPHLKDTTPTSLPHPSKSLGEDTLTECAPSLPFFTSNSAMKRYRTQMSNVQLSIMRKVFEDCKTPSVNECEKLDFNGANNLFCKVSSPDECVTCGARFSKNASNPLEFQEHIFSDEHLIKLKRSISEAFSENAHNASMESVEVSSHFSELSDYELTLRKNNTMTPENVADASKSLKSVNVSCDSQQEVSSQAKNNNNPLSSSSLLSDESRIMNSFAYGANNPQLFSSPFYFPNFYQQSPSFLPPNLNSINFMQHTALLSPHSQLLNANALNYNPAVQGIPIDLLQISQLSIAKIKAFINSYNPVLPLHPNSFSFSQESSEFDALCDKLSPPCPENNNHKRRAMDDEVFHDVIPISKLILRESEVGYICKLCSLVFGGESLCAKHLNDKCLPLNSPVFLASNIPIPRFIVKLKQRQISCQFSSLCQNLIFANLSSLIAHFQTFHSQSETIEQRQQSNISSHPCLIKSDPSIPQKSVKIT